MTVGRAETNRLRRSAKRASRQSNTVISAIYRHAFSTRRRTITTLVIIFVVPIILVQLLYPRNSVLPNTSVGSVKIGGMSKEKAADALNGAYDDAKVPVYFSDSDEVVIEPKLAELGIETDNSQRVGEYTYPTIARFIPYSLFWYHLFVAKGEPSVVRNDDTLASYITTHFGDDCEFDPVDATITYTDSAFAVVDATRGGSCEPSEMLAKLKGVSARLNPEHITVEGTSTAPNVSTKTAQAEYNRLVKKLSEDVSLKVEDKTDKIAKKTVAEWVNYSTVDGKLTLGLSGEKVTAWLTDTYGKKFTSAAGTTVITSKDYAKGTEETGKSGQALNTSETINELIKDLNGTQDIATLKIDTLEPAVEYKRTYSDNNTALSQVMKKYADTHDGTYGVKMVELSGQRRNAEYNSTKQFTTASTYKLFVAYSTLLRIESGELAWTDTSYGGQSVSVCFDKMIKLSNNECAVWFLLHAGQPEVTREAQALGATHTSFLGKDGIKSTPADEAHFLSLLYSGQLLSQQTSRDRLIQAMKGNVYVAGIPTGIPNATVADKVGFLDALLHDAAIVYSPKGDYVLIIMTDNATWADIAALAKDIEAAR